MADPIAVIEQAKSENDIVPPIEVNGTPIPDQLWALVRQLIPPVVAFLVGRGIIKDDVATLVMTVGGVIVPIVWGQVKTRLRALQLAVLERHVDNSIAIRK